MKHRLCLVVVYALIACITWIQAEDKAPVAKQKAKAKPVATPAPVVALSAQAREEVDQLIKQLSHEEYRKREMASDRIIEIGPGALPQLQKVVSSEDVELRSRLTEIMRVLQTRAMRELTVLTDHEDWVWSLEFSHSGKMLASAGGGKIQESESGKDSFLRIWNCNTYAKIKEFEAHKDTIFHLSWSQDDTHILTASADGSARIWNAETGEEYRAFRGHSGAVLRAFYVHEDQHIVTVALPNQVRVFEVASGKLLHEQEWSEGTFTAANISPDTNILAVGSGKKIKGINLTTFEIMPGEISSEKNVTSLRFSLNAKELYTTANESMIQVWSLETFKKVRQIVPGHGNVEGFCFSHSVPLAACFTSSKAIVLLDNTSRPIRTFQGHSAPVLSVAFSANGEQFASAGKDNTIRFWNLAGLMQSDAKPE